MYGDQRSSRTRHVRLFRLEKMAGSREACYVWSIGGDFSGSGEVKVGKPAAWVRDCSACGEVVGLKDKFREAPYDHIPWMRSDWAARAVQKEYGSDSQKKV